LFDKEDRRIFMAYFFGNCIAHDHKISLADIKIHCDQTLLSMNEPITTKEDLEVIETIANMSWYAIQSQGREKFAKKFKLNE